MLHMQWLYVLAPCAQFIYGQIVEYSWKLLDFVERNPRNCGHSEASLSKL